VTSGAAAAMMEKLRSDVAALATELSSLQSSKTSLQSTLARLQQLSAEETQQQLHTAAYIKRMYDGVAAATERVTQLQTEHGNIEARVMQAEAGASTCWRDRVCDSPQEYCECCVLPSSLPSP
jgi:hypothetical protein